MSKHVVKKIGLKLFVLAIALGLVISQTSTSERVLFAAEEESFLKPLIKYEDFDDPENLVEAYHDALNEEVNKRVDLFLSAESKDLEKMEKIPVKKEGESRDPKKCPLNATSTWCLSQKMLNEYYAFRKKLISMRNQSFRIAQGKVEKDGEQLSIDRAGNVLKEIGKLDSYIDRELSFAQDAMDLTLVSYNELHMAYPLHLKLQELIDSLEDYRDAIRDVRDEVEIFPATFFNVQTTQCT